MMIRNRSMAICLLCALLAPGLALSDDIDERIAALEARVDSLETRVDIIEMPQSNSEEASPETVRIDSIMTLDDALTMTINHFETGTRFRYYPSGGFISSTLSAKTGYALLGLFVTVENGTGENIATADLLNAELSYNGESICAARDSFYYMTSRGVYAGGLKTIPPNASVEGCILFALPEDVAQSSGESILFRLHYDDTVYEHVLRESGGLLPAEGDAIGF